MESAGEVLDLMTEWGHACRAAALAELGPELSAELVAKAAKGMVSAVDKIQGASELGISALTKEEIDEWIGEELPMCSTPKGGEL